jgi:hypothetical protein
VKFFLGTHQPGWLSKTRVPLFISFTRLRVYKTLPKARSSWALDSGAFSELIGNGRWTITAHQYADGVRRLHEQVGRLEWASIQDWICSPAVVQQTGLQISIHQKKTIESLQTLRHLAPDIAWLPVLQGWDVQSYLSHLRMYEDGGFRLDREPLVGVGSLASRQDSEDVVAILEMLRAKGIRTHAFGVSLVGLQRVSKFIESADSMVWSFTARRRRLKHIKCKAKHPVCNNCLQYALSWRGRLLNQLVSAM